MISKVAFFVLSAIQFISIQAANLRTSERELYYGDDSTDDFTNATDSNSTHFDVKEAAKTYTINHLNTTYTASAQEWTSEQWGFFGFLMFIFGFISSIFFLIVVFPNCCPATCTTAYARFLSPPPEDSRKVKLIKK